MVKVVKKLAFKHGKTQASCPGPSSLARGLRFDVTLTVQEAYLLMVTPALGSTHLPTHSRHRNYFSKITRCRCCLTLRQSLLR